MASIAAGATLKGALVIAVLVVLLHSSTSMGQQPAPASASSQQQDCGDCTSKCYSACQGAVEYETSLCNTTSNPGVVYQGCIGPCANSTCNGNSYASHAGRCTMGTCSPDHCGGPCVQNCCKSCTAKGHATYDDCVASAPRRGMEECMPGCLDACHNSYGCGNNA